MKKKKVPQHYEYAVELTLIHIMVNPLVELN